MDMYIHLHNFVYTVYVHILTYNVHTCTYTCTYTYTYVLTYIHVHTHVHVISPRIVCMCTYVPEELSALGSAAQYDYHMCCPILQVLLPDLDRFSSQPLYLTVRGFTGCEDMLESTSNGFVIDPSPPTIEILGTGENAIERAQSTTGDVPINHTIYQTTPSFSSLWETYDGQSELEDSALVSVGTYPGGRDVLDSTTPTNHIRTTATEGEGLPHYVTVQATNRAGVSAVATGDSVVLDTSAPTLGEVRGKWHLHLLCVHPMNNHIT